MGCLLQLLLPLSAFLHPLLRKPPPRGCDTECRCPARRARMRAVPPSICPLILWSCLHFSLCLFYIFITSRGLRSSGWEGGVRCCQAPTGQFARRGALWPLGSSFTFFSSSSQD